MDKTTKLAKEVSAFSQEVRRLCAVYEDNLNFVINELTQLKVDVRAMNDSINDMQVKACTCDHPVVGSKEDKYDIITDTEDVYESE